jgi:hypothetical protein
MVGMKKQLNKSTRAEGFVPPAVKVAAVHLLERLHPQALTPEQLPAHLDSEVAFPSRLAPVLAAERDLLTKKSSASKSHHRTIFAVQKNRNEKETQHHEDER